MASPCRSAVDAGYAKRGGPAGVLGWPVAPAATRTAAGITGSVESFQQGDLYVSPAGTGAVLTVTRTALAASPVTGTNDVDALGWPTADATTTTVKGGGTIQPFTGGRLYVPATAPALTVTGPVLATYLASGEVAGGFGWPTGAASSVTAYGTTMTVQPFQTGAAYVNGTSVSTVSGATYTEYLAEGGPTGRARLGHRTLAAHGRLGRRLVAGVRGRLALLLLGRSPHLPGDGSDPRLLPGARGGGGFHRPPDRCRGAADRARGDEDRAAVRDRARRT